MAGMDLKTELKQAQHLSPQLLQSTRILQMDVQELHDFVERAVEENPILEKAAEENMPREIMRSFPFRTGERKTGSFSSDDLRSEAAAWNGAELAVADFLNDQLERMELAAPLKTLCKYLVQLLDENGYLSREEREALKESGVPEELTARAVTVLQSLEPAGIGACDLQECLLLQLQRLPDAGELPRKIVEAHLDALGKYRWHHIAKELHTTESAVREAAELIRGLSPRPGYSSEGQELPEYVIPDILIVRREDKLEPVLNEGYIPHIYISDYYNRLYHTARDEETRKFLQEHMQQAKWVIDGLERRYQTLLSCGRLILEVQREFFLEKTPYVTPMTQKQAAQQLGLHESTLGRCIHGKYLQCSLGTYPLQYFFSRPLPEGQRSEQALRIAIQELIRNEEPLKPCSDQKLTELLTAKGFSVARRTVTKHRLALGIPPAGGRKKCGK